MAQDKSTKTTLPVGRQEVKNKPKANSQRLKTFNIENITEITILFEYNGKQYMLIPKPGDNESEICMIAALQLALDHNMPVDIIDPDIEKLHEIVEEIIKEDSQTDIKTLTK